MSRRGEATAAVRMAGVGRSVDAARLPRCSGEAAPPPSWVKPPGTTVAQALFDVGEGQLLYSTGELELTLDVQLEDGGTGSSSAAPSDELVLLRARVELWGL